MVFYGIKSNAEVEFYQLEAEIASLIQQREIAQQNNLTTLHKEIGLSTLANGLGAIITQSILSSKYVFGCIGDYFSREWLNPTIRNLSPLTREYQQIPSALTQLKYDIAETYPFQNRLTVILLATSAVCARNVSADPWRLMAGIGRVAGVFAGLSFIGLPEVAQSMAKQFIFDLE